MYKEKVGIIGGFGAYATLNFYKRILEEFASESERNYPHIIMDNNFTMPSRTRALLYGDEYNAVVEEIISSFKRMLLLKVDYIILVCGTAHAFLPDVYKEVPEAANKVLNLIDIASDTLKQNNIRNVLVIAAEGTLKQEIYPKTFIRNGIKTLYPLEDSYDEIRYFIECVKQNKLDESVAQNFLNFLRNFKTTHVLLGCTEFPALVEYISTLSIGNSAEWKQYVFWNPLDLVIEHLKHVLR